MAIITVAFNLTQPVGVGDFISRGKELKMVFHCAFMTKHLPCYRARGHNGYIRGCYDHIFRHGFNDSSVLTTKLKYREFCTRTMMSSLIARKDKPPDTELFICSCRDSLCNRSNTPRSNSILITAIIIHIITIITLCSCLIRIEQLCLVGGGKY
ncbi:hypothetical protein Tsp_05860 [Trichinella spiralis]|uniref:hypothetical protein n=1 Tax=Trichinella spiralis TaxID=6334 RepID=UPI0001EFC3D7|nr:hypothetical protein Tsp_05860 [Trichinella spiralis]